jgi:hypothetical protein
MPEVWFARRRRRKRRRRKRRRRKGFSLVKDYEKAVKLSRVQEHGPFVHHDRGKGAGCDTNLEQMDGNAGPIPWS